MDRGRRKLTKGRRKKETECGKGEEKRRKEGRKEMRKGKI